MQGFHMNAGTNIGLRDNNEDNFTVCSDIANGLWSVPSDPSAVIPLGERGALLVVADGMGGQNAGEVASAIAVQTVHELFAPEALPPKVTHSADSIKNYLCRAIVEADVRVKAHAANHPDTAGMGSTLVLAWVMPGKVHVAWIGDSRAYIITPDRQLVGRLSKDHSYVQQLVDRGQLTDEEAMVHPNSNIITRSLGDSSQRAHPDAATYDLNSGDVVLLCSDGLCGTVADAQIGGIVEQCADDLVHCREQLTNAALAAGGSDNITIALLRYVDDAAVAPAPASANANGAPSAAPSSARPLSPSSAEAAPKGKEEADEATSGFSTMLRNALFLLFGSIIFGALCYAAWNLFKSKDEVQHAEVCLPSKNIVINVKKTELAINESTSYQLVDYDKAFAYQFDPNDSVKVDTLNQKIKLVKGNPGQTVTIRVRYKDVNAPNMCYEVVLKVKRREKENNTRESEGYGTVTQNIPSSFSGMSLTCCKCGTDVTFDDEKAYEKAKCHKPYTCDACQNKESPRSSVVSLNGSEGQSQRSATKKIAPTPPLLKTKVK